ncbi:MAG: elongation factor P maturation arginine rhamnosyltransferase EarP [Rudaea sp.]
MQAMRWDVVCRVVDNYGDAGVCWRLARQLVAEHRLDVTLWLDRLSTLAHLEPAVDPGRAVQAAAGVTVRRLDDAAPPTLPDVIVEGFGCGLPAPWLDAMAHAGKPPLWINLEYLSAEPWVDSVHGLASVQPRLPLTRYFWFPGFTAHTGGLAREAGLLAARDAWQSRSRDAVPFLRVVLFCYPNRALTALFDAWAEGDEPIGCTVPEGVATAALDAWLRGDVPHVGQSVARGRMRLDVVPFRTQDAFDRVLWDADVNFVRGEDSFVRAQWAARPFVWQPYPQAEDAHRLKLEAFLSRYVAALPAGTSGALADFWRAFSDEDEAGVVGTWPAFRAILPSLEAHGRRWARELAALPELAAGLVEFARARL